VLIRSFRMLDGIGGDSTGTIGKKVRRRQDSNGVKRLGLVPLEARGCRIGRSVTDNESGERKIGGHRLA